MKPIKTIAYILCSFSFIFTACGAKGNNDNTEFLISNLSNAEKEKDKEKIGHLFSNDAIILLPDSPPIVSNKAICALYEFLFSRNQHEQSEYVVDSVSKSENSITEFGKLITIKQNQEREIIPFYAIFEDVQGSMQITQLNFGNTDLENHLMNLPAPTGEYNIGQSIYFFEKNQTSTNRYLSLQVWYPTNQTLGTKSKYQSAPVAEASAKFLRWPLFANSSFSLIETNTYRNAHVVPDKVDTFCFT